MSLIQDYINYTLFVKTLVFLLQEGKREERKKLADEDALRKIKQLEEHIVQLQKQVATHKQV